MLPTPSTSHVSFDNVYEPAEDSYLLLDTLSSDSETSFLSSRFGSDSSPPLVLEVGVGSGVVLAFIAANAKTIFGRADIGLIGTDVNPIAAKAAAVTVEQAIGGGKSTEQQPILLSIPVADLTSSVRQRVVDVLIFNPPYVPSETLPLPLDSESLNVDGSHEVFERDSKLLELSYAGGVDGMETTNRLLDDLPRCLSDEGVAYVLLCAQNKPMHVIARIYEWPGSWLAEIVGSSGKKAGWEKLVILRIWRSHAPPG